MEEAGGIYLVNSSMEALREAQLAFAGGGETERVGLETEEDVDVLVTGDYDFEDISVEKPEILTPAEFVEKYC